MTKKQREYQQSLERCKKSQAEQCTELQHRTEMVNSCYTTVAPVDVRITSAQILLMMSCKNNVTHVLLQHFLIIGTFLVLCNGVVSLLQLQVSLEEARSRVFEVEQEVHLCQRERDEAQKEVLLLQTTVERLTQVRAVLTCLLTHITQQYTSGGSTGSNYGIL